MRARARCRRIGADRELIGHGGVTKSVKRTFQFALDYPVEVLWEIIADTQRLNQFVGNPKYEAWDVTRDDGSVDVFGRTRYGPIMVVWQELPVNWIELQWYEQIRRFENGPLREIIARIDLSSRDGGCTGIYQLTVEPRNLIGTLASYPTLAKFETRLLEMVAKAQAKLDADEPIVYETAPQLPRGSKQRARQIAERIEASPYGHGLAQSLVDFVLSTQEVDLWTLRPLALARQWDVDERSAIEVCLQAVREGLLESRWDLLCPRCRVSKAQALKMDELPEGVHCTSCNIDYEIDFARNVELAFSPGPSVRPIEFGFYCRSGPGGTPHIKGQITLDPGERRTIPASFSPGDYRLRTLEAGGELDVDWSGGGFPNVVVTDDDVTTTAASAPGTIDLINASSTKKTLIVEDRSWRQDVLTAERVMTLQAFRDLFSDQVLRPGDDVVISNVTFMFTDLAGSTSMYETVGDARAYRIVRELFATLGSVIRDNDGTIVKTIGDGIHAAFSRPEDALEAAIAMQRMVTGRQSSAEEIAIRVGLHTGSSISVTLNERLDYYGATVNMAARLEGQGKGGQITMSEAFVQDVRVAPLLRGFAVESRSAQLKGIQKPVTIYQFSP